MIMASVEDAEEEEEWRDAAECAKGGRERGVWRRTNNAKPIGKHAVAW
jgi:hypothetical protein